MIRRVLLVVASIGGLLVSAQTARAEVKPHALFTDGMVLQRDAKCTVWGTADPGEGVGLAILKGDDPVVATKERPADKNGKWSFELDLKEINLPAGGPYTMKIGGKNSITIKDVYVGDVWICSGQSNMEQHLSSTANAKEVIAESGNSMIRLFTVPHKGVAEPATDINAKWQECSPKTAGSFSAVAYYFGRDLQKHLKVPIGLIHTSVGGTPAEAWTSKQALEADPKLKYLAKNGSKLYNGMIAPLLRYSIKGAIWYQGESNAGKAYEYRTLFPAMIKNWRTDFKQGDFPFLFVQIAPWQAIVTEPQESAWAELREAQLLTSLKVPNTAMAVITDVGDPKDIHPKQKEPVGARLALAARALAYKEKIEYSGPVYDSKQIDGNKIVLSFKHLGKGLEMKGEALQGFTIAGEDKKFYNAKAEIKGDKVVVWCDKVEKPIAVRYGWANCPVVNLWNKDGLPASPFRTDDFPMLTAPKK
jgi:sialate O-acetylesterase